MNSRIYVGNLAFHTTEDSLRNEFARFGSVSDVRLVLDRESGRSRGFAFVTMGTDEAAKDAIGGLNGVVVDGRPLRVNQAEARPERSFGGGSQRGGNNRRERW